MLLGPDDYAPTPGGRLILETLRGDLPATFDGGADLVDVRDVAAGMASAGERGDAGDHYILTNRYVTLSELTRRVSALAGRDPPRIAPYPAVYAAAVAAERWADVTGGETLLARAGVRTLRARLSADASRARQELEFEPRPLAETLWDAATWFIEHGDAPGVTLGRDAPVELSV
jgi:dihydroflavonol-4-reductase